MRILVSGSTGFVGTALVKALSHEGHAIFRLMRPGGDKRSEGVPGVFDVAWNPGNGEIGDPITERMLHAANLSSLPARYATNNPFLVN